MELTIKAPSPLDAENIQCEGDQLGMEPCFYGNARAIGPTICVKHAGRVLDAVRISISQEGKISLMHRKEVVPGEEKA
jgi:hypothetical protein